MTTTHEIAKPPLDGIRVLNLGIGWAGSLASMLLAEQGADVVEIQRPDRTPEAPDPLLHRGKRVLALDLKDAGGLAAAQELAAGADIVIDNMRPGVAARLGLDHAALDGGRGSLIYLSLPGFAEGDPRREIAAWDGLINASAGVYTDISPVGRLLGGAPVFSAIPMASAYGGVLGALSVSLALHHRRRTGRGQRIEVPLADAVMAAMALLIADIDGQPWRYNFPAMDHHMLKMVFPIFRDLREHMSDDHVAMVTDYLKDLAHPALTFYEAADGRIIFVCAFDHIYQTRTFLQVTGVYDRFIAEGMVCDTPYSQSQDGNNINKGANLRPEYRRKLRAMIGDAIRQKPAAEWEAILRDANVPVSIVQTTEEWLAHPVLRAAGVTSALDDPVLGPVAQPGRFVSIAGDGVASPPLDPRQDAGTAASWQAEPGNIPSSAPDGEGRGMLAGIKVLDFSNVVAGPAAGRTLAEHGADVVRIDPPAPLAGPYHTMWFGVDVNQGKRAIVLDLKAADGRRTLEKLVRDADVVLHNYLDGSARTLGIDQESLSRINPEIISCQVGAWSGADGGDFKDDPAFDPVLQAATGIMARYGDGPTGPVLHAIASCVDYITGFLATVGIVQALYARAEGRGGSFVGTSLAMGAQIVQFPYMVSHRDWQPGDEPSGQTARGHSPAQSLYRTADGWVWVGCRPGEGDALAAALGAAEATWDAMAARIAALSNDDVAAAVGAVPGGAVAKATSLAEIRADRTLAEGDDRSNWLNSGSFLLRRRAHPSGYPVTVPLPTWIRPAASPVTHLEPAPMPGAHTGEVLAESGHDEAEIAELVASGAAQTGWPVLNTYLPR